MPRVAYLVRMVAKEGMAEEVREQLLSNPAISEGEEGSILFALHSSKEDPNEFWIYEVWDSEEAVNAHESSEPLLEYREKLRPMVEGESVVWGNTEPFAVRLYGV